jgi:hypothetical protein
MEIDPKELIEKPGGEGNTGPRPRTIDYSIFVGGFFARRDAALRACDRRFEVFFVRGLRTGDGEGRGAGERDFASE